MKTYGIMYNMPLKGYKHSEEARKKMSIARMGKPPWNKGTKGLMKNLPSTVFRKGCTHLIGFHHSPETIQKLKKPRPNLRGEHHHNWKGGRSKNYKHQTSRYEYKKWRRLVFERDGFTCQDCGCKGGYLTAHHIKSWTKYPELRYEISNGITLCEDCHSKTDNYKGHGKKH